MASAKDKKTEEKKAYSFEVKSGDNVSKYTFRRSAFNDPEKGRIEVEEMFDKGALKEEYAEMVQNLVKIKSGVIVKEK